MWSADSDQQYSQWALNPSAYQNVSHEQVDWAALAQQWIQMKDTCPGDQMPPAPPPPLLGPRPEEKSKEVDIEGGEAPMEMDKEEASNTSNSQDGPAWGSSSWNNWQQQWGGGWGWGPGVAPPGGVPPPSPAAIIAKQSGTLPLPGYGYTTTTPGFVAPPSGVFNYNQNSNANSNDFNQVLVGGYWTAGPHGENTVGGIPGHGVGPAPFIRNNRQDWAKRNNRHDRNRSAEKSDEEEDSTIALDAAKRRSLPAWIREGLEKMEREKQKKIDRDRQIREREIYMQKQRDEENNAMNEMQNNNGQPMMPKKSKFESDSEESDHAGEDQVPISSSKRKSRFRNADSPSSSPKRIVVKEPTPEPEPPKSREEILQETMLKVRRMLTEILLEVTTEEMEAVAQEVLSKAKAKAPALQLRKTPALASLTGKLGLGIYGDSEESDSGDDSEARDATNAGDSDEELKDQIVRRKSEFSKTEREIEARVHEQEEREKRFIGEGSDDSGGEERQVENNQSDKRPIAPDGTKIKVEPQDKSLRSGHNPDYLKPEESYPSRDHFNPPHIKKEIKCEHITGHRRVDKKVFNPDLKIKREKLSSDEQEGETSSKSDSESSSSSKSSSSAGKTSSSESRRSSKKSRQSEQERKGSGHRKHRDSSDTKKSSSRLKERQHESREVKTKDRKRDRHDRVRSRSKESRRSKRSPSRDSRRSKSDRKNGDVRSRKSDSHRRFSNSSKRSQRSGDRYSREKSSYKSGRSRSPVREKKRGRRESTVSRSRSVSTKRGKYSRSRSSSPAVRHKMKRRESSASSGLSSRATGKTARH